MYSSKICRTCAASVYLIAWQASDARIKSGPNAALWVDLLYVAKINPNHSIIVDADAVTSWLDSGV